MIVAARQTLASDAFSLGRAGDTHYIHRGAVSLLQSAFDVMQLAAGSGSRLGCIPLYMSGTH